MNTFDVTALVEAYRNGERGRVAWEVAQLNAFFERENWYLPTPTEQSQTQTLMKNETDSSGRYEDT